MTSFVHKWLLYDEIASFDILIIKYFIAASYFFTVFGHALVFGMYFFDCQNITPKYRLDDMRLCQHYEDIEK